MRPFTQLGVATPVLLALFAVSAAWGDDAPELPAVPKTLSGIIDSSPSTTFIPCPGSPHILAIYREQEPQWWGNLEVYHRSGESIGWQYAFPKEYEEHRGHYVVRVRWITLRQASNPLLEVIESTHMGNGSLRIWEVAGRELRLLLEAPVRGRYWSPPAAFGLPPHGEAYFDGEHLTVEYQSSDESASDAISLTGTVRIEDLHGKTFPSRIFAQTCVWEAARRVFVAQAATSP